MATKEYIIAYLQRLSEGEIKYTPSCYIEAVKYDFTTGTKVKLVQIRALLLGGFDNLDKSKLTQFAKLLLKVTVREVRVLIDSKCVRICPKNPVPYDKIVIKVLLCSSFYILSLQIDLGDESDIFRCFSCKELKLTRFVTGDAPKEFCQCYSYCLDCAQQGRLNKRCTYCTKHIDNPQNILNAILDSSTTLIPIQHEMHEVVPQEENYQLKKKCKRIKCKKIILIKIENIEYTLENYKNHICVNCFGKIESKYKTKMPQRLYSCPNCYDLPLCVDEENCKMCVVHIVPNPLQLIQISQICILCVINQTMVYTECCRRLLCKNARCNCDVMARIEIRLPTIVVERYKDEFQTNSNIANSNIDRFF